MIKKPDNWETTEAMDGTFKQLTPGGHKCIIKQAKVGTSKTGNEMLILCFDIADGDKLAGFYMDMYGRNVVKDGNDAKWPNNGIYRQVTSGKSEGIFKGLIVNIEKSNPGYTWNWNERSTLFFAILIDGEWYERGEMGWFGISSKDKKIDDWKDECYSILNAIDPKEKISLIDCHI
jgi:hypothetical protein